MRRDLQREMLTAAGASASEIEELLAYNRSVFEAPAEPPRIPLGDELFVEQWTVWAAQASEQGILPVLIRDLPQLWFPVRKGQIQNSDYRAAVLGGKARRELSEPPPGFRLEHPERVELEVYASFAGRIPVLYVRGREEFVALVQALAKWGEPVEIPEAQGAMMVAGMVNNHRLRRLREAWERTDPAVRVSSTWREEAARIKPRKELYQDRLILLSDGPYSAVPAADLGLEEAAWREISLVLRREHEVTHYFTRRFFGAMRNHLLDELMADYTGIVAATGRFRADWFLRFLGIDGAAPRPGARVEIYRGKPPLSDGAFAAQHEIMRRAAAIVERVDRQVWPEGGSRSHQDQAAMVRALGTLGLLALASPGGEERLVEVSARELHVCSPRHHSAPLDKDGDPMENQTLTSPPRQVKVDRRRDAPQGDEIEYAGPSRRST